MSKSNIIEINGKRYDARSGALIESTPSRSAGDVSKTAQAHAVPPTKQVSKQAIARQPAQHANRKLKASATLMRHAVRKPSSQSKMKANGHTDTIANKYQAAIAVKPSVRRVNHHRLAKAQAVDKSHLIRHFSPVTSDAASLARPTAASTHTTSPTTTAQAISPPTDMPQHATHRKPRTTSDVLEHALKHASSHEPASPTHKRRNHKARRAGVGLAAALIVVVGGFTLSQNIPNIRMQMATAKAGFHASLPDYQPPGFHLADVDYSDGVITSGFRSNSDDRSYRITQSPSQWTNSLLVDSFVGPTDNYYETVQHGAQTIYLYDNGSATWVRDGVWYVITSKGVLSNRQLITLATSF